jgi:hypothetical protein
VLCLRFVDDLPRRQDRKVDRNGLSMRALPQRRQPSQFHRAKDDEQHE